MCNSKTRIREEKEGKGILRSIQTTFRNLTKLMVFTSSVTTSCIIICSTPFANPRGGHVASGNVTIHQTPRSTVVNQSSQKAIINWQSFNIGKKEAAHFMQPAGGVILNRINPMQGASQIFGRLTATGQIILINAAGIYFGPAAYVNVGSLIASTADITNQNFINGIYRFSQLSPYSGSIINQGQIIAADHGLVALVGSSVSNTGIIQANLGSIVLASGNAFTISFAGNDMVSFSVDEQSLRPGVNQKGKPLRHGVSNTGKLIANGGSILISTKAAQDVLDNAINMKGVVEAKSVSMRNGEIIFEGNTGTVTVSGKVIASGKNANEKGGTVKVLGNKIALTDNAMIDVSGTDGGGVVLIGGNFQGLGVEQNADYTYIGTNTSIKADALAQGNGGKVIAWANAGTKFYGNIFARGGSQSGDGGFVETSGKAYLEAMGTVDASASQGRPGAWLLDPANVTISNAASTNGSFNGGNPNLFTTSANTAVANVATINASLNGGTSVTILTSPGGTQAGNITVSSPILKSVGLSTPTLTLTAAGTITVNNPISSTSGGLNVTLTGDALVTNAAITTNGGNFSSTTQNAATLANVINTGTGTVAINANQDGAGASAFTMNPGSSITSGNAVSINVNTAAGGTGVAALRSITAGNGGTISVASQGGSITQAAGTLLDTGAGNITLTTQQNAGLGIGSAVTNMLVRAGRISSTTGSAGIFLNNSGTSLLTLDAINTTGSFTLTSANSANISQNAPAIVAGTINIVASSSQDITLNNIANDFGTARIDTGNNVTLRDVNALILGDTTVTGNYDVTAGGSITESGVLTVIGTPSFTLTTPGTDIALATQQNNFNTAPIITDNGNVRDLSLLNTNVNASLSALPAGMRDLTLIFDNAAEMVLPSVTLTRHLIATSNGDITQAGSLSALTTTLTAGNDINLTNAGNDFGTLNIVNGNNVSVADSNALVFGPSIINGTLDVTTNGALTQSGAITVTGTTTLAAGANDITLNNNSNDFSTAAIVSAHNVILMDINALTLGTSTVTGNYDVTANGIIGQTGAISGTSLIAKTLNDAGAAINLNNNANEFASIDLRSRNTADSANTAGTINYSDATGFDIANIRTTSTTNLISSGAITDSGTLISNTLTATSMGGLVLDSANQISNYNVTNTNGPITLVNAMPLTITGFSQIGSGTVNLTTTGTLAVANGATIHSGNNAIFLSAADLDLNVSGAINSGIADTSITQNMINGSIGLGDTAGSMTISGSELQRITANNLNLTASGQIIVDNISSANSANIAENVILTTTGISGSILFQNNESTFRALTANSANGITVNPGVTITTLSGNLALNADANTIAETNDTLNLNASLISAGSLTLSALNGGIALGAPISLTANGDITINDAMTGGQDLILNSGSLGNITFNGNAALGNVQIINTHNFTNNAILSALSFLQLAGNLTNLGNQSLNTTGNTSITATTVIGVINTESLALNVTYANLSGSVAGISGSEAISLIQLLNSPPRNTHFWNGIDMVAPSPTPVPPAPVPPISNLGSVSNVIQSSPQPIHAEASINPPSIVNQMGTEAVTGMTGITSASNSELSSSTQVSGTYLSSTAIAANKVLQANNNAAGTVEAAVSTQKGARAVTSAQNARSQDLHSNFLSTAINTVLDGFQKALSMIKISPQIPFAVNQRAKMTPF